jgi:hypothetical protein
MLDVKKALKFQGIRFCLSKSAVLGEANVGGGGMFRLGSSIAAEFNLNIPP